MQEGSVKKDKQSSRSMSSKVGDSSCVGRFGARVATFGEFTVFAESVQQNVCPAGQRVYSILRFAPPLLAKIYVNDSIDQMAKMAQMTEMVIWPKWSNDQIAPTARWPSGQKFFQDLIA